MQKSVVWCVIFGAIGCGASSSTPPSSDGDDGGGIVLLGDDAATSVDAASDPPKDAGGDGAVTYPYDGGVLAADRFVTGVVSVTYGACAGYGQSEMPQIVEGPPVGGGQSEGSVDVVSLGNAGEIVLTFAPNAIVDGPGPDFIVFENPFDIGASTTVYAEPGEVSVSDDGTNWSVFPCTATAPPYGSCAGWHPVYSSPANGISPVDPNAAGGDAFDLADLGVTRARYVRIRDMTSTIESCPATPPKPTTNGFDLDAIAIINAQIE